MYAYIKDNKVKLTGRLPRVWRMKDGSTVSGFHLKSAEVHKSEGWLPIEENRPEYDEETEYLTNSQYDIQEDKVIKTYTVEDRPEDIPTVEDQIKQLENRNTSTLLALTEVYEEKLELNGRLTATMLGLTEVYEDLEALKNGGGE